MSLNQRVRKALRVKGVEGAKKALKILYPAAKDFTTLLDSVAGEQYDLPPSQNAFDLLLKHDFYHWVMIQSGYKRAKRRLMKKQIMFEGFDEIRSDCMQVLLKQFYLHKIYTSVIVHGHEVTDSLDAVVIGKKFKDLVAAHEDTLTLMARNFELEAEEYLFLSLVGRLKNSQGSIVNAGKEHPNQLREYMTKRLIFLVLFLFKAENVSANLTANIAQDIIGDFFEPAKLSDDCARAKKMVGYVELNSKLLETKVIDLIFPSNSDC